MMVYKITNSLYMCPNCITGDIRYYSREAGLYKSESIGFCKDCECIPTRNYIKTAKPLITRTAEREENE